MDESTHLFLGALDLNTYYTVDDDECEEVGRDVDLDVLLDMEELWK